MACLICNGPDHDPMAHDGELSPEEVAALRRIVCKLGHLLTSASPLEAAQVQVDLAADFRALSPAARPLFSV